MIGRSFATGSRRWCLLLVALGGCARPAAGPHRMTMEALHQNGGVPPGWTFTPPSGAAGAGRQVFVEFGCPSCHAVQGEAFAVTANEPGNVGPDLSGMGSHHPPEYFAESILNPDAVLVDGPGYISESGHSMMPSYPDMTLRQLADLVAYLSSLKTGGAPHSHVPMRNQGAGPLAAERWSYLAQAYEIEDAQIDGFYRWFDRRDFAAYEGLVNIDTYASRLRDGRHLILCVLGFTDDLALSRFAELRAQRVAQDEDFVRPVRQFLLETPALYRAPQMSLP